jgi:acetyl esterase/lipase
MKPFILMLSSALLASAAFADTPSCTMPGTDNAFLGIQTIRLWPGTAPEAKGATCNDIPALTILEPRQGSANGSAVIILPGGGYVELAADLEGRDVADWFTVRGFRAFILSYRLPANGYLLPVPLLDARRAIQTVRARSLDYHINPNHIVVIGFSAGGHLAALAATQFVAGDSDSDDPIARASSRPDFLVLGYPWIGAVGTDFTHLNYCKELNLVDQCAALRAKFDPVLFVSKLTPPTFIYHTFTDETVPVEQPMRFYEALVKAGVPSELHIFAHGEHGSGLGSGDPALDQWPTLLENWLRAQGLLTVDKAALESK